jgi:hypothetical protein
MMDNALPIRSTVKQKIVNTGMETNLNRCGWKHDKDVRIMGTLNFKCNGCVRKCKIEAQGTPDERLERYFICPDITMHDKKYQDPIMEKDPSKWDVGKK